MISNDLPVIVNDKEWGLGKRKREDVENVPSKQRRINELHISDLPAEILIEIMKYLNIPDLLNFEGTCRFFRNGIAENKKGNVVHFSERVWQQTNSTCV